jgi:hypothetical protein
MGAEPVKSLLRGELGALEVPRVAELQTTAMTLALT